MMVEQLTWDSDFFGMRIGRACISSNEDSVALANLREKLAKNYDLLYIFSSHGVEFLSDQAKLVDEKVVYTWSKDISVEANLNVEIWDSNRGVTDDLLHLALVSGKYSRFKLDEGFPNGSYERLYSRWIEQSVSRVMATEVFCFMIGDIPRGVVTLDRKDGIGTIGLVAIHEDCQHQGLGSAMMHHVNGYAKERHCNILSVATQLKNIPACRLYEKNGFEVESVTDVWHWWL